MDTFATLVIGIVVFVYVMFGQDLLLYLLHTDYDRNNNFIVDYKDEQWTLTIGVISSQLRRGDETISISSRKFNEYGAYHLIVAYRDTTPRRDI